MVTLCSSAQMKSLVRVRSYNVCRLRPACFWFTAAIMAVIVRQALSCPGQGLLFCQEHWIIFIALMGVWCEGEPTIRGVEITLLKWLPLPPIIKLAETEASTLKDVTTAQPWTETRCHPRFGLSAADDQQCLQLLPSLKSVSKPPSRVITCRRCLCHSPKLAFCRFVVSRQQPSKSQHAQGQYDLQRDASSCKWGKKTPPLVSGELQSRYGSFWPSSWGTAQ